MIFNMIENERFLPLKDYFDWLSINLWIERNICPFLFMFPKGKDDCITFTWRSI